MRLDESGPVSSDGVVPSSPPVRSAGPAPFYRRRAETVIAEQFIAKVKPWPGGVTFDERAGWHTMDTPSGPFRIKDGDWLVTRRDGIRFVIKPDMFPKMYEPCEGKET